MASDALLRRQYPPCGNLAAGNNISRPCIIVDRHGIILAWYLPGILTEARQVNTSYLSDLISVSNKFQGQMLAATEKLRQILQVSVKSKSWRSSKENFQVGSELPTGVMDFVAAWFEQGHQVSC